MLLMILTLSKVGLGKKAASGWRSADPGLLEAASRDATSLADILPSAYKFDEICRETFSLLCETRISSNQADEQILPNDLQFG